MSSFTNPLDSIKVASPCSADWNNMIGDNRSRFCGECKLNVYNLSGMTRNEAENLIMNSEGRLCARFFRRADGSIITKDCPVGWAAVKKRMSRVWTAVASMALTAFASVGIVSLARQVSEPAHVMGAIPVERPVEEVPLMGAVEPEMGDVAATETMSEISEPMMGKIAVEN